MSHQFLNKQDVRDLAEKNNCTATYDHSKRIMYIMGDKAGHVLDYLKKSSAVTYFKVEGKMTRIAIPQNI